MHLSFPPISFKSRNSRPLHPHRVAIQQPVRIQNKKMKTLFSSESRPALLGNYTVDYSQLLGRGTTGTVYRGYHNLTSSPAAVKVIDLATIKDDATRSLLENEKLALQTVAHPNVVKLLEIVERDGHCFIVTELCEGETLRELIQRRGRLTQAEAMGIFRKLLAGCLAVTQNCIIHRDLKPANIIVSPSLEPKLIDFGFCEVIQAKKVMRTFNVGSPSYMAPEAYLRTLYSEKSDSWSLGMILFEMLAGRTLDEGQVIREYFELLKGKPGYVAQFTGTYNDNVRQILEKALKYLPEERMSISSMKYAADVYQLHQKRQDSQTARTFAPSVSFNLNNSTSLNSSVTKTHQTHQTLHSISGETLNCSREGGFISFADFSKPQQQFLRGGNKMSQVSLSSNSNKSSSVQYSIGRMNENYQFLANKTVGSGTFDCFQSLSSKDITERRLKGAPVFRQVTVRYL